MKRLLTLVVCSLLAIWTVNAKDIDSGTFKNGGSWKITDQGELYIDAVTVPDYPDYGPWEAYSRYVKTLHFSSKITTIGKNAFRNMYQYWRDAETQLHIDGLKYVEFDKKSSGNVIIKDGAFDNCRCLAFFDFSYITEIGKTAFKNCYSLNNITLPAVTKIDDNAFDLCHGLFGNVPGMYITTPSKPVISNVMDHTYIDLNTNTGDAGKFISIVVPTSTINQYPSQIWDSRDNVHPKGRIYPGYLERTYNADKSNNGYGSETGTATLVWWYVDGRHLYVNYEYGIPDFASPADAPWYSYRDQITDVTLAGGTPIIGKNAFANFTKLTTIYNSNKIKEVHEGAFKGCTVLGGEDIYYKRIDFSNVKVVGKEAFANCTSMKSIGLPRVTTIEEKAFKGCTAIGEISLGVFIENIGSEAFANTLQQSTIKGSHFQHEIYMHENAPTTANDAFSGTYAARTYLNVPSEYAASYLTDNTWSQFAISHSTLFPVSGTIVGGYGTWSIDKYGVLTIDGGTPNYNSTADVPWHIYQKYIYEVKVTENCAYIGKNTFASENEGESKVTKVAIPETVETIGENAFKNNDQIEEVQAEGVKNIGSQAFENCSSLEKVKFGKEVSSMGEKVFNNCGLVDVMAVKSATPPAITARTFEGLGRMSANAPAKVKAKYAARRATSATGQKSVSLEVPDEHISKYLAAQYWNLFTFEYIGEHGGIVESDQAYDGLYVLYSDGTMIISASAPTDPQNINTGFTISSNAKSKVKRVEIQGLLTKLGHQFNDCPNLEEVVLSGGINSLNGTFNNCPKLKTINLENVQYLKSHQQGNKVIPCFGGCVALQEVNVPNVLEIGDNCFKGCTGLTKVALGGEAEVGMEAFSGCTSLKRIALGNAKLNGALQAFQGCTALEEMTYSGTRMPAEIFKGCTALHKINLGGSLKDILSEAFANTSIDSIYVQCPTPPEAAANAFSGITLSSIKVIVPDAFESPYSSAPVWEEMFTYEDEDYAELDFPIHFAIGDNGFGTVDESGNLTINAMGALVDNFRDYVEPYAPYIIGEIRIGNEVSSLPAGTPYRLPFGWVKENGPRAIVLGSGLLELGDYALYNNVWDCDLIVDCYALNPPVMKGANVFNWSRIQNGSQCVATLNVVNDAAVETAYRADTYWKKFSISSWLTPADAPAECTVTFVDWNGTILQQTTTRPGMVVTPPADPVREGYTFKGWDSQDYTWVVSDLTITATYYDETYTVRFYDWDGTLLSEQQVHYGQAAKAPADPVREGRTFLGWSEDFSAVTLDSYIVAMYNQPDGVKSVRADAAKPQKVLVDGVLYIIRPDGAVYNAQGMRVR